MYVTQNTLIALGIFSLLGWLFAVWCGITNRAAQRAANRARARLEASQKELQVVMDALTGHPVFATRPQRKAGEGIL